jgi:hypothetical protein
MSATSPTAAAPAISAIAPENTSFARHSATTANTGSFSKSTIAETPLPRCTWQFVTVGDNAVVTDAGGFTITAPNGGESLLRGSSMAISWTSVGISGNLVNNGTIQTKIGGTAAGQYDVLAVTGNVTLGGTLNAGTINGFAPIGQSFDVITASAVSGSFSSSNVAAGSNKSSLSVTGNAVTITSRPRLPLSQRRH